MLFLLLFGKSLINSSILKNINDEYRHLFFALLLFAHSGYLGVVSTNDLFNIYVFVEISSLATYVLMSISAKRSSLIGAFDYLVIGTIGATLILIGIGFILAYTGGLNISQVASIISLNEYNKVLHTSIAFILVGVMLKIAFLPMHFWMRRAYMHTSSILLTYFAAIGSIFCICILMRFLYFVIDIDHLTFMLERVIRPAAFFVMILGSFLAVRSKHLKEIVVYSTTAQIGYIFLLVTIIDAKMVLFFLLIIDAANKIALFTIIAHLESKTNDLSVDNFVGLNHSVLFKTLTAFALLSSVGLPFTSMFFVKISILQTLLSNSLYVGFVVTIASSLLSILYHLKITKMLFLTKKSENTIEINEDLSGLVFIVALQFISLFYISNIANNFEFMY